MITVITRPTLELLNSSTAVAIGGGFRLHIAFLFAGIAMNLPAYCACALIIYATYTLDRTLDCKEDMINRREISGADPRIGFIVSTMTFSAGALLFISDGIYLAPFFPFIVGYIYTRGVKLGPYTLRLKGGAGVKNIIIGITWGGSIALVVSRWCSNPVTLAIIFAFFVLKLFTTSCINDIKDVRGDLTAGIRTIPVILGEKRTKFLLAFLVFMVYGMTIGAIWSGEIQNEWIIVTFSLVLTIVFLAVYSPSFEKSPFILCRKFREIVLSWEYPMALVFRGGFCG